MQSVIGTDSYAETRAQVARNLGRSNTVVEASQLGLADPFDRIPEGFAVLLSRHNLDTAARFLDNRLFLLASPGGFEPPYLP